MAERQEADDSGAALKTYDEIQAVAKDSPAVRAASQKANYLVKVDLGNLQSRRGAFEPAGLVQNPDFPYTLDLRRES